MQFLEDTGMDLIRAGSRVGFLPEETYFFRDGRKKVEETISSGFLPSKSGRKWKKPENNGRKVSNVDVMQTKDITYMNKLI